MGKRIQLTLFVDCNESEVIENVRKEFNPKQYELIKSHVTLCREDELVQIESVIKNLEQLNHHVIFIDFGQVKKFSNDRGVLIPAKGQNEQFQQLREIILGAKGKRPRMHEPHITLMHPRNSICTDETFGQIEKIKLPGKLKFKKISLIEQEEEGLKWKIVREFELKG